MLPGTGKSPPLSGFTTFLLAAAGLLFVPSSAGAQSHPSLIDSAVSQQEYVLKHFDEFATEEYRQRMETLREFQRKGYSEMLYWCGLGDGISAAFAYMRMALHIEFSIYHTPLYFMTTSHELIVLPFDWSFPDDPWREE